MSKYNPLWEYVRKKGSRSLSEDFFDMAVYFKSPVLAIF